MLKEVLDEPKANLRSPQIDYTANSLSNDVPSAFIISAADHFQT
jgi:hypothetical protein